MPIYEYRCSRCGRIFEEWAQSFDSPEHEPCPHCGGDAARIMSHTSFVLKGEGWYVTEYGNRNKTDHESGAGAPDGTGDKAGTDGKAPAEAPKSAEAESGSASAGGGSGTAASASASSSASGGASGSSGSDA